MILSFGYLILRQLLQRLIVEFDECETLDVWDPEDLTVNEREFRITGASRVRWEWFYYGRLKTAENRYFIEHVRRGETVIATTNMNRATDRFKPTTERPAVELLGVL